MLVFSVYNGSNLHLNQLSACALFMFYYFELSGGKYFFLILEIHWIASRHKGNICNFFFLNKKDTIADIAEIELEILQSSLQWQMVEQWKCWWFPAPKLCSDAQTQTEWWRTTVNIACSMMMTTSSTKMSKPAADFLMRTGSRWIPCCEIFARPSLSAHVVCKKPDGTEIMVSWLIWPLRLIFFAKYAKYWGYL